MPQPQARAVCRASTGRAPAGASTQLKTVTCVGRQQVTATDVEICRGVWQHALWRVHMCSCIYPAVRGHSGCTERRCALPRAAPPSRVHVPKKAVYRAYPAGPPTLPENFPCCSFLSSCFFFFCTMHSLKLARFCSGSVSFSMCHYAESKLLLSPVSSTPRLF